MNRITPSTQDAYNWKFDQTEEEVVITFPFSKTFNIHSLEAELIEDNNSIIVKAPDHIPFLAGHLAEEASKIQLDYNDNENIAVLHIIKKVPKLWEIVIKSNTLTTYEIDPKSAYLLAVILQQEDLPDDARALLFRFLQMSCNAGFVPALIYFGSILIQAPQTEEVGLSYLQVAAEGYQSPDAYYLLGKYLLEHDKKEQGVLLLEESLNKGFKDAAVDLGRMLSPYSGVDGGKKKDGKAAIEMLEKCDNPRAKLEIAKIYFYGCDEVPKDVEKANQIYKDAKELDPSLPSLEETEAEAGGSPPTKKSKGLVILFAVSIVSLFGFLVYNQIKRHK